MGGAEGVVAHRQPGDKQRREARQQQRKEPRIDGVGKRLQPALHHQQRHGPGEAVGRQHQERILLREQAHDARRRREEPG